MYTITCQDTARVYVGVSVDPARRYKQHKHKAPRRMRADAAVYKPFERHFVLSLHGSYPFKCLAHRAERQLIAALGAMGPAGYTTLPSTPGDSRRFWGMFYNRRQAGRK